MYPSDLGGECHHDFIVFDLERNSEWKGSGTVLSSVPALT